MFPNIFMLCVVKFFVSQYQIMVLMSYAETENTYNTLIESKIYRTSILFVISFAYIAISNWKLF